ncbi:MAG: glutathione peroxidase [Alphaproteobacteria bacterium]|nr:glutathione peroxidase [Alphaproteobacteria bacterium]
MPPAPDLKASQADAKVAYVFSFAGLLGGEVKLDDYAGRPILVVNTASKCGFTSQYAGLEKLWNTYKDKGLVVIGIPSNDFGGQEPGDASEIKKFCDLTYGVTFPMTAKQVVKGADAHPFYQWAKASFGASAVPKWNFHKILIGVDGTVVDAWSSMTGPSSNDIKKAVERELAKAPPPNAVDEE